ncbi:MAG: hypothetical protein LBC18_09645, partial [Opitutaceae bacterium]|nr:hypothetical protein [Opitutaceae bacterium]
MKTAFRNLRLALALCVCAPGALHAAAYTWTGGTSSDWDNASNWSGGVVPAFSNTTDTVTINVRSGPVLTSLTATTAAFTIGGAANTTGSLALINSSLYSVSINSGGNATGTAFITLDNSTWYVPNNLFLGGNGHAVVELHGNSAITNAGPVSTTGNVGLAQNAGAVGILTLNDNSVWQSANILYVGFRSSGTLHMNDNSKAVSRTNFYIGGNGATTARGWVDMSGAARITVGGFAEIGSTGIGALIMSGNSLLNISGTANTLIGASAGAEGAVTLSDNAVFRTAWDLLVGAAGDGRITFLNGGFVQANASVITLSASSASSHGTIEIAGNGAHSITRIDGTTPVGINGGAGTAKMRFAHSNPGLVFGNPLTGSLAVEVDG